MNPSTRQKLIIASLYTFLLLSVPTAWAQQQQTPPVSPSSPSDKPKDPQSSFEPRSGPGEGQKLMEKMVGKFDVVKSIFPVGKDPVRTKGKCQQKMIHQGHYLQSDFEFEELTGGKSTGTGVLGFDSKTGQFSSVWEDSRSTTFSLRQSEGTFDGQVIELYGRSLDPAAPARRSRTIARLEENGRVLVHQQFVPTPDGKERMVMELRMTRK